MTRQTRHNTATEPPQEYTYATMTRQHPSVPPREHTSIVENQKYDDTVVPQQGQSYDIPCTQQRLADSCTEPTVRICV